jgi:Cu-processing system ATP-binding protein
LILKLESISKSYEEINALDAVSMEIKEGEVLGLVGPNGAGKSTLLKIMLGISRPSSGKVLINGEALSVKEWKEFKRSVGYMPERVSFYDNLTGKETLKLFARVKGGKLSRMTAVIERLLPEDVLLRKVGGYSKGMRQRLNLAQALVNEPDFLVLDEPTSGLDPLGTKEFYDILEEVKDRKKLTVILSSHILAEIEDKTDRVAVLKNGNLKAIGRLEELCSGMNIPLRLYITIKRKDEFLEDLLKREGAVELGYENGYLHASMPRENKLELISAIMEEKDRFSDFSIREPSLEEVFFGVH